MRKLKVILKIALFLPLKSSYLASSGAIKVICMFISELASEKNKVSLWSESNLRHDCPHYTTNESVRASILWQCSWLTEHRKWLGLCYSSSYPLFFHVFTHLRFIACILFSGDKNIKYKTTIYAFKKAKNVRGR